MPTYTYECKSCGNSFNASFTWNEINENESLLKCVPCKQCGSIDVARDFSGIRINADQGKFDPKSPMYWKNGKSPDQIATILNNNSLTP